LSLSSIRVAALVAYMEFGCGRAVLPIFSVIVDVLQAAIRNFLHRTFYRFGVGQLSAKRIHVAKFTSS